MEKPREFNAECTERAERRNPSAHVQNRPVKHPLGGWAKAPHLRREEGRDGVAGDGFAAAYGVHAFVGFGFEVNFVDGDAEGIGQSLAHFGEMGAQLGAFDDDHGVDVLDGKMFFVEKLAGVLEEEEAVGAFPLGIVIRKMRADVAQASSAEKSVAECVSKDVAIGMADGTLVEWDFDAADDKFAAFGEAVKIVADPATNAHGFFCSAWR